MKTSTRKEILKKFVEIIIKHGDIKNGEIFNGSQLISKIAKILCKFGDAIIVYEYNSINVYSSDVLLKSYADDFEFIGYAKADEWYTKEQLMALSELVFGYYI